MYLLTPSKRVGLTLGIEVQRTLRMAIIGAVAVGLLTGTASSANAAAMPRDPAPGVAYRYGVPVSEFATALTSGGARSPYILDTSTGGWSRRTLITSGRPDNPNNYPVTPGSARLSEPYRLTVSGTPYIALQLYTLAPSDRRPNKVFSVGSIASSFTSGGFTFQSTYLCATAPWSDGTTQTRRNTAILGAPIATNTASPGSTSEQEWGGFYSQTTLGITSNCTHLLEMDIVTITYSGTVPKVERFIWSAESYYSQKRYNDSDDILKRGLCLSSKVNYDVYGCRGEVDLQVEDYCEGSPILTPTNWEVMPTFINHWMNCMWVPLGGWDRESIVQSAWKANALSGIGTAVGNAVASFQIPETCGVLVPAGATGWLSEFSVNTCTWASWGLPLKGALTIFFQFFIGLSSIVLIASILVGVLNKKTVNPLAMGDDK